MRARLSLPELLLLMCLAFPAVVGVARAATPRKVTGPEISMLVRTTIVALHQANLTGNYSVLRDLGDRQFQAKYSAAQLADMFRKFRLAGINLAPAVLFDAQLDAQPRLTTDGLLRVVGHFPTKPKQIIFDAVFRNEMGRWRIESIDVGLRSSKVATAPAPQPARKRVKQPVRPAPLPTFRLVGQRVLPWP